MGRSDIIKNILDNFLIQKEGKLVLKNIEKRKLVDDGIIDSLDILSIASEIEKKTKKKLIFQSQKISINLINIKI